MADDFNENDLATEDSGPSEIPQVNEDAIQAALDKFYGKDSTEIVEPEADAAEAPAADTKESKPSPDAVRNRMALRKKQKAEEREELLEDGLETESEDGEDEKAETATKSPADTAQAGTAKEKPQGKQQPAAPATPKIDPSLRYFAETELGLKPEEIAELEAVPGLADKILGKAAADYTANLSRQLQGTAASQPQAGTQQAPQTPAQPVSATPKLDQFYAGLTQFAEANGEEFTGFFTALKDEVLAPFNQMRAELEVAREQVRKTEARSTFTELREKFADLYGKAGAETPEQQAIIQRMGQLADGLRVAAQRMGQELPIGKAIRDAHLMVSADYRDRVVRQQIKEQVQKRAKGITVKPAQTATRIAAPAKSREAASQALELKLAELGQAGWE
jgi:hypothetical protein